MLQAGKEELLKITLHSTKLMLKGFRMLKQREEIQTTIHSSKSKCIYCDKWYNPTRATVKSRITALNSSSASENRFYCSSKCKNECPIFHQHKYPKGYKTASSREVQSELRKLVFHRDNWECIRCGATAQLHCHHITGVELNPVESADIDNCITFCKKMSQVDTY